MNPTPVILLLLGLLPFAIANLINVPTVPPAGVTIEKVMFQPAAVVGWTPRRESLDLDVLDWTQLISQKSSADALDGQQADLTGIVYHSPDLKPEQVLLVRQRVAGAVSDAQNVSIVVEADEVFAFRDGTWARIVGQFESGQILEYDLPILNATEIYIVQQPEQPYIYP